MSSRSPGVPDRRRLNGRRSWLRRRIDSSPPVPTACAIYVVITLLSVGSWVMPFFEGRGISSPPASGPVTPALAPQSAHPLNATDCGLVSATYIQGTVSAIDWPPSYATDVEIIYANLCNDSAFVTLLSQWGGWYWFPPITANGTTTPGYLVALNLTLQFGWRGPPSWGNWSVLHGDLDLLGERPSKRQFVLQGPPVSLERDLGGESPRDQLHRSVPLHLHAIFSWEPPSPQLPRTGCPRVCGMAGPSSGRSSCGRDGPLCSRPSSYDSNAPALRDSLEGGGCERVAPGAGCAGRASPGYASVSPGVERRTWTSRFPRGRFLGHWITGGTCLGPISPEPFSLGDMVLGSQKIRWYPLLPLKLPAGLSSPRSGGSDVFLAVGHPRQRNRRIESTISLRQVNIRSGCVPGTRIISTPGSSRRMRSIDAARNRVRYFSSHARFSAI